MVRIGLFVAVIFLTNQVIGQKILSWKVQHPVSKAWYVLGEKGSVQEALIAANQLPDPFVGMNESQFNWIENYQWTLESEFFLREPDLREFVELDFPSIDTYASIFLNGKLVAETNNAFVRYRFDVRDKVVPGKNKLKVVFTPPIMYQKPRMADVGVTLPAPNDVGKIKVAPHCRKPQYQFGWDWSLRMLTMGFWEPVKVEVYSSNRVLANYSNTLEVADEKAVSEFTLVLAQESSETFTWKSTLFGDQKVTSENTYLKRTETISNPKLWWPRGQGEAYLYNDHWILQNEKGDVILEKDVRFGLKKVELVQEKDQWGTSFQIRVNNRPVFCKGADYIPDDIFPARITDEKLKKAVQTMLDCNFNMVRIWGGGFYPRESFLEACDEGGLMVWEDFMFACAMYPGTDDFLANVKTELDQQIPRLASHASLTLFNGNNEVDVAWKNWGFQKEYHLSKKDEVLIGAYYRKLFKELIPETLRKFTDLPYEHTSPLSNWGNDAFYNDGTQHYWGVWHGTDPIEDFGRKSGRFNAEYGFQSFPELATLLSFSKPKDWKLDSPLMKLRQKSYVGNNMIAKHSDLLYGKTADFQRFVYFSQLTQAKAVGIAVVAHRSTFPRCAGTLYWQFNDCWPAPTWSSMDYFGRWKALQYEVKNDFKDVTIAERIDTLGKEKYVLISDIPTGFLCEIEAQVSDFQGNPLGSFTCRQAIAYPHTVELFPQELKAFKGRDFAVRFIWKDETGKECERLFIHEHVPGKSVPGKEPVVLVESLDPLTGKGVVNIENETILKDFWFTSKDGKVVMDQNFVHLLPGKHRIAFEFEGKLTEDSFFWFYH
ncbi:glycoside hydrolase family 2 protein [Fluviicola chungangensis]|uniref:beta-mannosidase n=1 Tax=Fluviicola chungangensis TaxID=2597671 RepID=A0A556N642_9FLAO|nr:glycoside hydrolase family 2 protein [Fluviicola chungangensis]TSJ47662.1 glycoside hydrolase family 2 protein [Fluviicola chungangensis]